MERTKMLGLAGIAAGGVKVETIVAPKRPADALVMRLVPVVQGVAASVAQMTATVTTRGVAVEAALTVVVALVTMGRGQP